MPLICEFDGIKIYMYFHDHNPPHFHVHGNNISALVDFSGRIIAGDLPGELSAKVTAWAKLRKKELEWNWNRAQKGERLVKIDR
ncbi:MAG: DUF4160 domain-containing protein [Peptococcaceae bacterium]|nr:DUF4160 domain-containing protein [Peptococcaceae bacterium]